MAFSNNGRIRVNVTGARGPVGPIGPASGPLGSESVTAQTIDSDDGNAIADKIGALRSGGVFLSSLLNSDSPVTGQQGLVAFKSERSSTIDMVYYNTRHLSGSSCYSLHIVDYAESGASGGGSLGVALDGPGNLTVGTFNRQGPGSGHGVLAQRLGSGNGSALYCNFSGLGTGTAVTALKQNNNGSITPGAASGLGPALEVTNQSSQGAAIDSTTTSNNASAISNTFRRENVAEGVVVDLQTLLGGSRTGAYTSLRILHNPATESTGTSEVIGEDITLGSNISGAAQTAGLVISNITTGTTNAFGAIIQSIGPSTTNRALRLAASGGTNNIALEVLSGISIFNGKLVGTFPQYADNASASASEVVGTLYRTATGEVRVVY